MFWTCARKPTLGDGQMDTLSWITFLFVTQLTANYWLIEKSNGLIYACYQLQLQQHDGSPPLSSDIESDEVSVEVTTTYRDWTSSVSMWNLTVPASGIVTLSLPVDANANSISMTVEFRRWILVLSSQTALIICRSGRITRAHCHLTRIQ